jgi:hypothetical protein
MVVVVNSLRISFAPPTDAFLVVHDTRLMLNDSEHEMAVALVPNRCSLSSVIVRHANSQQQLPTAAACVDDHIRMHVVDRVISQVGTSRN